MSDHCIMTGSSRFRAFQSKDEYLNYVAGLRAIVPKDDLIVEFCRGKEVLDLGCVDHSLARVEALGERFLHRRIQAVAKSLLGVDVLAPEVSKLNKAGYHIIVANVEALRLDRTFDVIVAGDLIEHLSNVGLFLESVERHMHDDSLCVITTPNPFNIEQSMIAIFESRIGVNAEHTCWIDPTVFYQLVERTGLAIVGFFWVETRYKIPVYRRPY